MSNKQQAVEFKRNDTFLLGCTAKDENNVVVDLTNTTVRSQIRNGETGALIAELVLNWVNRAGGTFELLAPDEGLAENWPAGYHDIDIQYTTSTAGNPLVRSSETFKVYVIEDVTQ